MELLVVGAGDMGRWFGEVLRSTEGASVSFLDTDRERARESAEALGGDVVLPSEGGEFDLVCIAVPIPAATDAIATYSGRARHAVIDVTGTMADPLEAMADHAPDCQRASIHPLFAPVNEPGNVPVVVDAGGDLIETVLAALRSRGNDVFETTASRHDETMETVQARTHAAILAFGLSASAVPDEYHTPLSAELCRLVEQVTDGESRVYADIQSAFEGATDVADAARAIADADRDGFERLYERARIEPTDGSNDGTD